MTNVKFSERIDGDQGNYKSPVEYELHSGGYLRISQFKEGKSEGNTIEITLLSPKQVIGLKKFLSANKHKAKRKPEKTTKRK
jgi:hypothetical protein